MSGILFFIFASCEPLSRQQLTVLTVKDMWPYNYTYVKLNGVLYSIIGIYEKALDITKAIIKLTWFAVIA